MEGLDISELKLSEVSLDNPISRLDSTYFMAAALRAEATIKQGRWASLRDCSTEVESFGAYDLTNYFSYQDSGIPFLRGVNIKDGFANFSDVLFVDDAAHALLKKSEVKPEMVLLTMSGSVGNATVALPSWRYPINSNQDIAKITPGRDISPFFLAAFLGSQFAKIQMERLPVGSVQQHIFLWMIESIVVPRFSQKLEAAIAQTAANAYELEATCVPSLAAAEQTLLHAIGLDAWQPPEPLTYVRRASEALTAVRLDAEYFKPKFDDLIAHLTAGGDIVRLDQVLSFCERGRQPAYADEGVVVVNSRHVRTDAVILDGENRYATVEDETLLIRRDDILLNGTGVGTIGRVAPYLHDNPALPDNHVTILRLHPESGFDPVFLAVQLAGVVGQTQVEQHTRGSSGQLEIYPQDIRRILVWRAPQNMQLSVRQNIEAAHAARREAQALLARAQRAVEVAIEKGEPIALKLLK